MNPRGYPPAAGEVRTQIEALALLPADAPEWTRFMRDVIRIPMWMFPAVLAAIKRQDWKSAPDPLEKIRNSVRQLAIEMHLSNSRNPAMSQLLDATKPDDKP